MKTFQIWWNPAKGLQTNSNTQTVNTYRKDREIERLEAQMKMSDRLNTILICAVLFLLAVYVFLVANHTL
jgi:hypothetical protein